ncbi:MAG: hypothetical protein ACXVB9_03045 [Bdellovibrionota bacterium]
MQNRTAVRTFILIFLFMVTSTSVLQRRFWPFCPLDMYSNVFGNIEMYELEGVLGDGREVFLSGNTYFKAYRQLLLNKILLVAAITSPEMLKWRLQGLKSFYDRQKQAGLHDGPAISALRVYRLRWVPEVYGRNIATPESRTLLMEAK